MGRDRIRNWQILPQKDYIVTHSCLFTSTPQSNLRFASSPAGEPFGALYKLLHYACPERGGGCECNEQTEGLHRGCSYLRQPLSQSALRRIASSPAGEPFGCDTICQDIRVNAQVGTRSPYSLPFVILPVPARSPFRLLVHRTRSTPNPASRWRLLVRNAQPLKIQQKSTCISRCFSLVHPQGLEPWTP